jgi:hypothetical protein
MLCTKGAQLVGNVLEKTASMGRAYKAAEDPNIPIDLRKQQLETANNEYSDAAADFRAHGSVCEECRALASTLGSA